jgi:hypothetical protein
MIPQRHAMATRGSKRRCRTAKEKKRCGSAAEGSEGADADHDLTSIRFGCASGALGIRSSRMPLR